MQVYVKKWKKTIHFFKKLVLFAEYNDCFSGIGYVRIWKRILVRTQQERKVQVYFMIKNIILDVGKVLVEWDVPYAFQKLGFSEETAKAVADATVNTPDWLESDRSAVSDEETLARFIARAPEYEQEIRLFWENVGLPIWQYDYARPWIQSLKESGYRVYILSNYGRWTYQNTTEALSFLEDVDGAVFSFEVCQVKPEAEIYQTLLNKYQLEPSECIFLDDRADNIAAAAEQGIAGIQFTGYEEALKELAAYGVYMQIDLNGMLYALSYALDCVEGELVGVKPGHGTWVAYLSVLLGKGLGMSEEELLDLAACAVLHDNALTQYVAEERADRLLDDNVLGKHCILGEENVRDFPFRTDVKDVILYHHEKADGTGFFRKKPEETPLMAQLIHLADMLDVICQVQDISDTKYEEITEMLLSKKDTFFAGNLVDLFFEVMPKERYISLAGKDGTELLMAELPGKMQYYPFPQVKHMLQVFGQIVDYKSVFTRNHSEQIAEKLVRIAEVYGYSEEKKARLYVAGVLHDIGKMAIHNDVLEKPDKLTDTEFVYMQNHAWYTYVILSKIRGFEDITKWAAYHHEKLNGKGYPFGLTGDKLDETERLVACVDIYQALSEDRPYKPGMNHEKCISIMRDMAKNGFIDGRITENIYKIFS